MLFLSGWAEVGKRTGTEIGSPQWCIISWVEAEFGAVCHDVRKHCPLSYVWYFKWAKDIVFPFPLSNHSCYIPWILRAHSWQIAPYLIPVVLHSTAGEDFNKSRRLDFSPLHWTVLHLKQDSHSRWTTTRTGLVLLGTRNKPHPCVTEQCKRSIF